MNKALKKVREINLFYRTASVDNSWKNISQESDPELWDILTNETPKHDKSDIIDNDEEIEGNDSAVQKRAKRKCFSISNAVT